MVSKEEEIHVILPLAKVKVKQNNNPEYLELVDKTDKAFQTAKPQMLLHNFDQDPNNSQSF